MIQDINLAAGSEIKRVRIWSTAKLRDTVIVDLELYGKHQPGRQGVLTLTLSAEQLKRLHWEFGVAISELEASETGAFETESVG